ncbi:ATP-binding cassette domain-containing protein [Actinomadura rayongensis]|uniref:ATP-binding cassette domain-containing protein n=2 Tax=Actinomadura rayongensis TaxID=1429076 RepID=A0A6I4WEV2_9ACTN|nr:ATP-binding cassette domain-containing protein [Actinomadura rayongensis]
MCTAVVGPSGAGKSTLLRLLNRLEEPDTGRVLLDGTPLPAYDVRALRRRVGLVAQRPTLLTEDVAAELRVGRPDLVRHRAVEVLARVGLDESFLDRATSGLSGGEAQRVCLARALAVDPQALLLDEPTSALDGVSARAINRTITDFVADGGTAVLVSHHLDQALRISGFALVLRAGRLVECGEPGSLDYPGTAA